MYFIREFQIKTNSVSYCKLPTNTCKLLLFLTEKLLLQSWILHLNFCRPKPLKPLTFGQASTLLIYFSFPSLPNPASPEQNQGRKPMSKWERWWERERNPAGWRDSTLHLLLCGHFNCAIFLSPKENTRQKSTSFRWKGITNRNCVTNDVKKKQSGRGN